MKKLLIIAGLSGLFLACQFRPASVRYNDQMIAYHYQIEDAVDSLSRSIATAKTEQINSSLNFCRQTISSVRSEILDAEGFENDNSLKQALTQYCKTYDSILSVYPQKIVKRYAIPDEAYTYEEHRKLEWIIKQFNADRHKNIESVRKAQENFRVQHNF